MGEPDGFLARQPSAVDSAFAVLEKVVELGPGVTGRELVAALPMSKATVYRIIKHLVENEYLVRTPDLTGFMLGVRVLNLARAGSAPVSFEDRESSPGPLS
jgi:DNA-binding IclR family transcriptional regulator